MAGSVNPPVDAERAASSPEYMLGVDVAADGSSAVVARVGGRQELVTKPDGWACRFVILEDGASRYQGYLWEIPGAGPVTSAGIRARL
jgi:hypothetical protein